MKNIPTRFLSISIFLVFSSCNNRVPPPAPVGPVPNANQIVWNEMEFYAFIHFTTNTFTNKEWGYGDESPQVFNPTALDTRQWARVVKEAGMKGIILTAKHHDGFCLWPSKYTEHTVKNAPWKNGKGDVVKELSETCKEFGLKLGLYLSPWDRNHADYGKPEYITYYRNQLRELLTQYGPVFQVWFDGANGGDGYYGGAYGSRRVDKRAYYDWPNTIKTIRELQPEAIIWSDAGPDARWVGNEHGHAYPTTWSPLLRDEVYAGMPEYAQKYASGQEKGTHWVPVEADVSIRPGWFYHATEDPMVRSLENLVDIYYKSVGRNANLLLNLPVDRRGLVHENDQARLKEMMAVIKEDFKTELLTDTEVSADNVRGNSRKYRPAHVIDGDKDTYWATDDGVIKSQLNFKFKSPTPLNRILLQEYIKLGQRIKKFSVEAKTNGTWRTIANETTIGYKRILRTERVTASQLRINIIEAKGSPVISAIKAYNAPDLIPLPKVKRTREGVVTITIEKGYNLYYTLDGTTPTINSIRYTEPFVIKKASELKTIAYNPKGNKAGGVKTVQFNASKTGWKILSATSGNLATAVNIIDANPNTSWSFGGNENKLPQEVKIDMGNIKKISGFTYLPRQTGYKLYPIASYRFYTSTDGRHWKKQSEGEFSNILSNPVKQIKTFLPVKARYLRLVALSGVASQTVAINEIGILEK